MLVFTGEPVSAQFYAYQHTTVPGDTIIFVEYSEGEVGTVNSWNWEFPGGTPSTYSGQVPPPVVYDQAGVYDVKLTVTNTNGDTDIELKSNHITVTTDIYLRTDDLTIDNATFYDPGFTGRYGCRTSETTTLRPKTPGKVIEATFVSFELEDNCSYDWLEIFDGPDENAPSLGVFCGTNNPGVITSTHPSGALTFFFNSNVEFRFDGWEADVREIGTTAETPVG